MTFALASKVSSGISTLCWNFFVTTTNTIETVTHFVLLLVLSVQQIKIQKCTLLQFSFIKLFTKYSLHSQLCYKVEIMNLWPRYRENPLIAGRWFCFGEINENTNVPRVYINRKVFFMCLMDGGGSLSLPPFLSIHLYEMKKEKEVKISSIIFSTWMFVIVKMWCENKALYKLDIEWKSDTHTHRHKIVPFHRRMEKDLDFSHKHMPKTWVMKNIFIPC